MSKKYLVYQTEHYYDGHGEEADGESQYFIADEEDGYQDTNPELRYSEGVHGLVEDTELYEQDGYHCTACSYIVKLLADHEVELAEGYLEDIANAMKALSRL